MRISLPISVVFASLLYSLPAHAYLDGGSAAMITQLIIGAIAGFGAWFGLRFQFVRSFFGKRSSEKQNNTSQPNAEGVDDDCTPS